MIDINELRRLAQAATPHVGHACKYQDAHWLREGHVDFENADLFIASERPQEDAAFYAAANPAAVSELLDRLEAAEKERDWHAERCEDAMAECEALRAKIEGVEDERMIDERRIADLMADLNRVGHENDALRAKIEAMEKQKPVAEWVDSTFDQYPYLRWREPYKAIAGAKLYTKFYALPGAKGEEK